MSKSPAEQHQRFPNLSKLGIAILYHLVESTLGRAAIEEPIAGLGWGEATPAYSFSVATIHTSLLPNGQNG